MELWVPQQDFESTIEMGDFIEVQDTWKIKQSTVGRDGAKTHDYCKKVSLRKGIAPYPAKIYTTELAIFGIKCKTAYNFPLNTRKSTT